MHFKKLPLILALIIFGVVVAVFALVLFYDVTYAKETKLTYLHNYNTVQGVNFYRHFIDIENEIRGIARDERAAQLLTDSSGSQSFNRAYNILKISLSEKVKHTDATHIVIIDTNFNVLFSTLNSSMNFNVRSWMTEDNLVKFDDSSIGNWVTGMMDSRQDIEYFSAISKVYGDDGICIGSVIGLFDFSYFDYFIHNLSVGNNGYLFLVDSEGCLVSDYYQDKVMRNTLLRDWNPEFAEIYEMIRASCEASGIIEFFSKAADANLVSSYYVIPEYNWVLFSSIKKSELYGEMFRHFSIMIAVSVLLLGFFVWLGSFFAKKLTSPLITFSSVMNNAKGGDFSSRWAYVKDDDYGIIAGNFNTMMERIQFMFIRLQETTAQLNISEERYRHTVENNDLDDLTGLISQIRLMDVMSNCLENKSDISKFQAFMIIDITKFKTINEVYGYSAGNAVLQEIAGRINRIASDDILVGRGEGDSYMIFIKTAGNSNEAEMIASLVLDSFIAPVPAGNEEIIVTCSIGVVVIDTEIKTADDVMACAFIALDEARTDDYLSFKFFNRSMLINANRRIQIRSVLEKNQTNRSLQMYLQPQYDIQRGKLFGFEALMRLIDKDIGVVPPVEFIPIAEETGLIVGIGYWAIRECCKMTKRLDECGVDYTAVAVNISLAQIMQNDFMRYVRKIIHEEEVNPARLEFEITESILLKSIDYGINILQDLKDFGIKVVLDDFGSGYSSLNYIRALSIDVLKIDKAFIDEICTDVKARDITEMIINLAKKMGLQIIAEGIETEEQLSVLRELGCPIIQGYYYSRPITELEACERFGAAAAAR